MLMYIIQPVDPNTISILEHKAEFVSINIKLYYWFS